RLVGARVMRDRQRPVGQLEHVELDEVDAEVDRGLESSDRVLRGERRRAAVADAEVAAVRAAPEVDQAARLIATTAQSSVNSPPAKARQSSASARASSAAG